MRPAPLRRAVLGGWAFVSLVLVVASWSRIQHFWMADPDDLMRLMQVRDLLDGQSWWDVGQHRMVFGDMHWSRLVDLPIAAALLLGRLFLNEGLAERFALVAVPLATMLAVLALGVAITRRVAGDRIAMVAVLVLLLAAPLINQLRPMRIDHHGWQVVFALAGLFFLLGRPSLRSGIAMGASVATLVIISLEGLPIAAALGGLAALAWAFLPARRPALLGFAWALFGVASLLHLATRGFHYAAPMCDAITPSWVLVFGIAALAITLATLTGRAPLAVRLVALAAVGAVAAGILILLAPECLAGPFGQLDPLTRAVWYRNVLEGMPIWRQTPSWMLLNLGLPISGLIGTALVLRQSEGEARGRWLLLFAAALAAFLLAVLVTRAGATANAFAAPGDAWLLAALLTRARAVHRALPRVFATVAALLVASPGLFFAPFVLPWERDAAAATPAPGGRLACARDADARAVSVLPPSLLFAPLQIGPEIILASRHRVIASSYHRNAAGIHDIIAAFTGTPDQAHAIIRRYGAAYVVACAGDGEASVYSQLAPNGFRARLERGERFDWLQPVAIPGSPVLAWRVTR